MVMNASRTLLGLTLGLSLLANVAPAAQPPDASRGFFARLGRTILNPNARDRPVADPAAAPSMADAEFADVPDWFRVATPDRSSPLRVVKGRLSATRERALADARKAVDHEVARWLRPEVNGGWQAPKATVEALIRRTHVEPIARRAGMPALDDYPVVYVAGYELNLEPNARASLVAAYQQDLVARRLGLLGSLLALLLIALAAFSTYVRADEATKGYYTNRLRMLTLAGLGAAGYVFYRCVAS